MSKRVSVQRLTNLTTLKVIVTQATLVCSVDSVRRVSRGIQDLSAQSALPLEQMLQSW